MNRVPIAALILLSTFKIGVSQQIKASYTAANLDKPFTGFVIAYLSKENNSPKDGMVGLEMFPCFSIHVQNIRPGQTVIFDDQAISYPTKISDIERGAYFIQIVWDRNLGGRAISSSPGNLFSTVEQISITQDRKKIFSIVASQTIPQEQPFQETEFVKEVNVSSALLTKSQHQPTELHGAVILPAEYYKQPNRKFPVLYQVFGYGGDYHAYSGRENMRSEPIDTTACIRVMLDGNCALGHSVYANSDNNGPWGDALTTELIPEVERKYRCNGARLLNGHSSGGWSALWLQVQYPDLFVGCWSSSPDPVDFRSFQKINLYEDKDMFYDADHNLRLVATVAGRFPWSTMKTIYGMEQVVYRGEQMHSFNAVFSKKGVDGRPLAMCKDDTGIIDSTVVENWKKYDISLYVRNHWDQLKPLLDNKVRISVGSQDNFLLNYPVTLLEMEMKKLNSGFEFAYFPGDHFTVFTPEYKKTGYTFLQGRYLDWLLQNSKR